MPTELLMRWGCSHCREAYETEVEASNCELVHEDRMKDAKIKHWNFAKKQRGFRKSAVGSQIAPSRITIQLSDNSGDYATYELSSYGPKAV